MDLLEGVLSSLNGEIALLDRNGEIIAVNDAWTEAAQANGAAVEKTGVGVNYLDVCRNAASESAATAQSAADGIESVLAGRIDDFKLEYLCDFPAGPEGFLMVVKKLKSEAGGALVSHYNLTRQKQYDFEAMQNRIRKLTLVTDCVPALISYVDADYRYRFVNRRYSEWFGRKQEDIVGKKVAEIVGETVFQKILPELEAALAGREVNYERLLKYKDGGDRFVRGSYIPDIDESGAVRGFIALVLDITESQKIEQELRSSEERFSKLFNFIPISITISSLEDHRYVDVNQCYTQMSGMAREEVIGRTGQETGIVMPEESVRRFFEALEQKGSVNNFETDIFLRNGEQMTILLSAVILNIAGEPFLAVASNNITERKKAERALRDLTTRLLNLQDNERRRIARELHDTTAQKISALLLTLSYLKKIIANAEKNVLTAIDEAISMAERSLGEIRTLSYVLHPPLLDQAGLNSALRWYVNGFIKRSGIEVELLFSGKDERLPIEMESSIFRVVQESLNNIHRHSGSSRAVIRLAHLKNEVVLEIKDEGVGIVKDSERHAEISVGDIETLGVGIVGMRERMRQFGGDLFINTGPSGTIITARIPLK